MTVFISRQLTPDADFRNILNAQGWEVHAFSLLHLTPLPFEFPAVQVDWVFFASGFGVKCFFEGLNPNPLSPPGIGPSPDPSPKREGSMHSVGGTPLPLGGGVGGGAYAKGGVGSGVEPSQDEIFPRFAALGPSTAAILRQYVPQIDFIGTGDPESTTAAFRALVAARTVLFPAARNSQRSVPDLLESHCKVVHLAVYDNAPLPDPPHISDEVLVFTSPMNATAYFSKHRLQKGQKVVAIGATTAKTLQDLGLKDLIISADANEVALAEAVLRSRH